jgi:hypothetical protein
VYIVSDPFKTISNFNLKRFSTVNRDYLSIELFLKNYTDINYDSFIFGSSRACGINTYHWKSYLKDDSKPFLFQAWGETVTGIYQKLKFLDNKNIDINNAIILIDIPGSFSHIQEPMTALAIKHYKLSGLSWIQYQAVLFYSFLKPSQIFKSTKEIFIQTEYIVGFDTITNDWFLSNKDTWNVKPKQDSTLNKSKFFERKNIQTFSEKLINSSFRDMLFEIYNILKKHNTIYKIIISPSYDQIAINRQDLLTLKQIFGRNNVYNYSGKNKLTDDKFNYMDINHFDLIVGWYMIEDIYKNN